MTLTRSLLCALTLCLCCACSGPTAPPSAGSGTPSVVRPTAVTDEHNDTDLAYVDRLSSQQQQAVDMVAMVSNRDVSPEVRELAAQIGADRADEVRALRRMARAWGVPPHPPEFARGLIKLQESQIEQLESLQE